MADALEAVATLCAGAHGGVTLTLGTNLFMGFMGDGAPYPDFCVAVYEYTGRTIQAMGPQIGVDVQKVQVRVRGDRDDYATARNVLAALRTLLAHTGETTSDGVTVEAILAEGTINAIGRDEQQRPHLTANFDVYLSGV